jgi:hypothetical protein
MPPARSAVHDRQWSRLGGPVVDSRIKWTGSGTWLAHLGGGGDELQTRDIAAIPAGLASTPNATIVALNTVWLQGGGETSVQPQVRLTDGTILPLLLVRRLGLSGTPNGWMYTWSLTDARLAQGGTFQVVILIVSVFGAVDVRGTAAAVIADLPETPLVSLAGIFGGGSDSPKTTHLSDPYPALTFALVGLSAGGSVPITMDPAVGWELLTETHLASVGGAAIAAYIPQIPLVDATFTMLGGPSGIISVAMRFPSISRAVELFAVFRRGGAFTWSRVIGPV